MLRFLLQHVTTDNSYEGDTTDTMHIVFPRNKNLSSMLPVTIYNLNRQKIYSEILSINFKEILRTRHEIYRFVPISDEIQTNHWLQRSRDAYSLSTEST